MDGYYIIMFLFYVAQQAKALMPSDIVAPRRASRNHKSSDIAIEISVLENQIAAEREM